MAKNKDASTLLLALGVTGIIIGGGGWFVWQQTQGENRSESPQNNSTDTASVATSSSPTTVQASDLNVAQVFSWGDRALTDINTPERQAGINAIAAGITNEAILQLELSLNKQPNDPEARIYLNNARIGERESHAIAVVVPTSTAINPAKEILRGVAQAQHEINQQGGINGVPLKVAIVNDGNNAADAVAIAQFLVAQPEILGVVGHFSSEVSQAAAEIYQNAGLVMISPTSTAVDLTNLRSHIFRTVPSDAITAKTLSRYQIEQLNQRQAAVIYSSASTYSQSLRSQFETELVAAGGQVVAELDVSQSTDLLGDFVLLKSHAAEVLVLLTNANTLPSAITVLHQNGGQLPVLAGDSLYNITLLQKVGNNAEDMIIAIPWHSQFNPQDPFAQTARQLWGGDVNWRTAMAYDATQALITALRQSPNRAGVQAALSSNFQATGAAQAISFLPSGDRAQRMQLVTVQPGSRSGTGFDFVPLQP